MTGGLSDVDVDWMDDPNVEEGASGGERAWEKVYPGFSRNPLFVSSTHCRVQHLLTVSGIYPRLS